MVTEVIEFKLIIKIAGLITVLMLLTISHSQAQVQLVKQGWIYNLFDIVYCNYSDSDVEIKPITEGDLIKPRAKILAKHCDEASFKTREDRAIFHVVGGGQIVSLSWVPPQEAKSSVSGTLENITLIIVGFVLAAYNDVFKAILLYPARLILLLMCYRRCITDLKENIDDANRKYRIDSRLSDAVESGAGEYIYLPQYFRKRITLLLSLYEEWRRNPIAGDDLRRQIMELS